MEITSHYTLKNGDFFNLTLTAKDGSPIANQVVDIIVIAESGEKTILTSTGSDGKLRFGIGGVNPGNYTFNGTSDYNACNAVKELIITAY